jgi:hypothetical protein
MLFLIIAYVDNLGFVYNNIRDNSDEYHEVLLFYFL